MAAGRSDDFLRRRNNEERAQNYRSITQCLWKPYSDHKTNSTADIAEYKSHTGFVLRVCADKTCARHNARLFLFLGWEKKPKKRPKGLVICLRPMGTVLVCSCVYL